MIVEFLFLFLLWCVVVFGGGFGGFYIVLWLDLFEWVGEMRLEIIVVDCVEVFVFKLLLYEFVNETLESWEVVLMFEELLKLMKVMYVKGEVVLFELEDRGMMWDGMLYSVTGGLITFGDGTTLAYDYLVFAFGMLMSDGGVVGVRECVVVLNMVEDVVWIVGVFGEFECVG